MREEFYLWLFALILVISIGFMIIFKVLYDRYPLPLLKMDTTYDVCDYVNEYYERNTSGMINVLEDCFYGGSVDELCEGIE